MDPRLRIIRLVADRIPTFVFGQINVPLLLQHALPLCVSRTADVWVSDSLFVPKRSARLPGGPRLSYG